MVILYVLDSFGGKHYVHYFETEEEAENFMKTNNKEGYPYEVEKQQDKTG